MVEATTLQEQIMSLFTERLNRAVPSPDTELFETGLLDSLALVDLLLCLEQEFGMPVSVDELDVEDFSSVNNIAKFILRKNG